MKTDEVEVSSPSCEGERASERTEPLSWAECKRIAEIARLEKALRDLIEGFRHLRTVRPAPYDLQDRLLAQAAKLRAVERKLFHLRQRRLL